MRDPNEACVSDGGQCTPNGDGRTSGAHSPSASPGSVERRLGPLDLGGPPNLGSLRVVAERAEMADAIACLTDSYGSALADSDPLALLARNIARSLVEAGFHPPSLRSAPSPLPAWRGMPASRRRSARE
jgi:hypothetical protein